MCGIAGIFDNNSKKPSESLAKGLQMMLNAIKHRGPDDRGQKRITSEWNKYIFRTSKAINN